MFKHLLIKSMTLTALLLMVAGVSKMMAQVPGALNGAFSVSANTQVFFSQGNLQYQASTHTWQFAENQWDFIGNNNTGISQTYSGWIDLFGWGTSGYDHGAVNYQPWSTSSTNASYYAYGNKDFHLYQRTGQADWGHNAISNGGNQENSGWKTLTEEEWDYVLNVRNTPSGIRFARATVNNKNGVILLPDDWDASTYYLTNTNSTYSSYSSNKIFASNWPTLEQAGAVFLPAAGYRRNNSYYSGQGYYWSSIAHNENNARCTYFTNNALYSNGSQYRYQGYSVRLVHYVQDYSYNINVTPNIAGAGTISGAGTHSVGTTCTLTATPAEGYYFANWTENGEVISTKNVYEFYVTGDRTIVANFEVNINNGALTGVFSVSEFKCVNFSPGNLQYQASTDTWKFAENQWDYVGAANSNVSQNYTGWIDMFGWGTSGWDCGNTYYQPWNATSSWNSNTLFGPPGKYDLTGTYANSDWGIYNCISNGCNTPGLWRTLTSDEWKYLFNTRTTTSGIRWAKAQVADINGCLLLPDNWDPSIYTVNSPNSGDSEYSANVIGASEWTVLEAAGVVFLPAAGYRNGTTVSNLEDQGCYWSSTHNSTGQAYYWSFDSYSSNNDSKSRYLGLTVRLVTNRNICGIAQTIQGLASPAEGGTVEGAGTYDKGDPCTLTAIPAQGYIFVNWTENGTEVGLDPNYTFTVTGDQTIVAHFALKNDNTTTGYLNGLFSISDGLQVKFSQGNLRYQASSNTWRFADHQWDYVGSCNNNASNNYGGWIDEFRWATSGYNHGANAYQPWSSSTNSMDYYAYGQYDCNLGDQTGKADWGYNAISNGGSSTKTWRTLTKQEWNYLFRTRTTASGKRFALAQVNEVNGIILLPDDWNVETYPLSNTNNTYAGWSSNVISASDWVTLENAGAVFLPAAANYGSYNNSTMVYWSASWYDEYSANAIGNPTGSFDFNDLSRNRANVASVRLIYYPACTVQTISDPMDGGIVTGAGDLIVGNSCTLKAYPAEGYTFLNWTVNGEVISNEAIYSFIPTGDITLVAHFVQNSVAPEGTINGVFSVSGDKMVFFSQGNLKYQASNNIWEFSENQWDYLGDANSNISPTYDGWIDLFGWGTSGYDHGAVCYQPWSTSTSTDDYFAYGNSGNNLYSETGQADWGYNAILNGGNTINTWRTLTIDEWKYLFNTRNTPSGIRYAMATVNNVKGVILLPDNWDASIQTLVSPNQQTTFEKNIINSTQWAKMETMGAVFLPGTGYRQGTSVWHVANGGYTYASYWSSTSRLASQAYYVYFRFGVFGAGGFTNRSDGCSVRLTRSAQKYTVEATPNSATMGHVNGSGSYLENAMCTLTATANEGYEFKNWTENDSVVSTQAIYSFPVTGNRTLVANFAIETFDITVTADPAVAGTVTGTGEYEYGTAITLVATANYGYDFVNWTLNNEVVGTNAELSITVTTDAEYVAHFTLKSFQITTTANPEIGGTVEGAGAYLYNTEATVTATPATGYNFVNWAKGDTIISTNASYTFTVINDMQLVANFEIQHFDITATVNPAAGGTIAGTGTYNYGTTATLTAVPAAGYDFICWMEGGDTLGTNLTYSLEVFANHAITALFEIQHFEITATANPAAFGTVTGAGTYDYGQTATMTATPEEGYQFVNWKENNEVVATTATYSFTVNASRNLVANFELKTYAITATANPLAGGTITGAGDYHHFDTCTLVAVPAVGYHFVNWTENGEAISTETTYSFTVSTDRNLVANFALNSYNIYTAAFPTEGGEIVGAGTYNHFETCTLTATANTGYTFRNWTLAGEIVSTEASYSFEVTATAAYVANFSLNSYEITATANPLAGGTVTGTGTYSHFETCTLNAEPATGYHFVNWTENGEEVATTAAYSFEVAGPRNLVANFALNSYAITAEANPVAGGTVTGAGDYHHFDTCTLVATPATGYHFVNWTLNGVEVGTATTYQFVVSAAAAYVANFEINTYTIAVAAEPAEGGTVTGAGTYQHGANVTVTATPMGIYSFVNWTENGEIVSTSATYSFTAESNRNLVANFSMIFWDVIATANPVEGGTVTGAGHYAQGQQVTMTATPAIGYAFVNWTEAGETVSTEATYQFNILADHDLVANFELLSYNIGATADPAAGGTVTGAGTYNHFDTCTLVATANTGYTFVNWTLGDEVVATTATYEFEVSGAAAYVAHFSLNSYEITATANPVAGGTVTGAGSYNHFAICELTATPATGYHFVNWTLGEEVVATTATYSFEVSGPAAYVAHFELNSYTIAATANPIAGGTISGVGDYHHFDNCTLVATANTGYTFVNWTLNGEEVATTATYEFVVEGAAAYVANFSLNSYAITAMADPTDGGTVTGAGTYDHFATCTLVATPATGYQFVNWTLNGEAVATTATYSFEVSGSAAYVAHFELMSFEVTATLNILEAGTVTGAGTYHYGDTATLTATVNEGYAFLNWTRDGEIVGTELTYEIVVTEAVALVANYEPTFVEITALANPEVGGTVTGTGIYLVGDTVTLTATPAANYDFVNWTVGNAAVCTEPVYEFLAAQTITAIANFVEHQYNITIAPVTNGVIAAPANATFGTIVTVEASAYPLHVLSELYYYTTNPEETTAIDMTTMQFAMPAADVTIVGTFAPVVGNDVNGDGLVNIIDVLAIINYVAGNNPTPFYVEYADVNEDGDIDLSDAMALNALILGLKGDCGDLNALYDIIDGKVYVESSVALAGFQFSLTAEPSVIDLPGFTVVGNWNNGAYVLCLFNLSGEMEAGQYAVIDLNGGLVDNMIGATLQGCKVNMEKGTLGVNSFDEALYEVFPVPAETEVTVEGPAIQSVEVFNTMGQMVMTVNEVNADRCIVNVSTLATGSYLFRINTTNGVTVRQVIVK